MSQSTIEDRPTIALTMGDPAGIGPEIVVRALAHRGLKRAATLVPVGDPDVLERAARRSRVPLSLVPVLAEAYETGAVPAVRGRGTPAIASTTGGWGSFEPGHPSEASGRAAARAIEVAAGLLRA